MWWDWVLRCCVDRCDRFDVGLCLSICLSFCLVAFPYSTVCCSVATSYASSSATPPAPRVLIRFVFLSAPSALLGSLFPPPRPHHSAHQVRGAGLQQAGLLPPQRQGTCTNITWRDFSAVFCFFDKKSTQGDRLTRCPWKPPTTTSCIQNYRGWGGGQFGGEQGSRCQRC